NIESTSANAGVEAPQLSWPPWQQQPHAFADDTTTPGQPADHSTQAPTRYAMGVIVVATAAVAGDLSYLWSSNQGSNSPDPVNLVSAAPGVPSDLAQQGPRAAATPSLLPESARRSAVSPSEEARLRERARQLTIKAARLWQVDAPARLI